MKRTLLLTLASLSISLIAQNKDEQLPPLFNTTEVAVLRVSAQADTIWEIEIERIDQGAPSLNMGGKRDVTIILGKEKAKFKIDIDDPRKIIFDDGRTEKSEIKMLPYAETYITIPYLKDQYIVTLRGNSRELKNLYRIFDMGEAFKNAYKEYSKKHKGQ